MAEAENCDPGAFAPVSEPESGQKLLRFLMRRLNLPESLLHRWLRTGQIRLNGKRCKPFAVVSAGDLVRLPPFARKLAAVEAASQPACAQPGLPPLLGAAGGIWAFAKPAGLAVHGGSRVSVSLAAMLAQEAREGEFIPAPAHRLDRDTSGILLVGATYQDLRQLQDWFAQGLVHKEYLAWTRGCYPYAEERLARHYLAGTDRVTAYADPAPGRREARCLIRPLRQARDATLLHIRLLTGCKRQIRAQLAAMGSPIRGDSRYGAPPGASLRLHACRVILPGGASFELPPPWSPPWQVERLPPPIWLPEENG